MWVFRRPARRTTRHSHEPKAACRSLVTDMEWRPDVVRIGPPRIRRIRGGGYGAPTESSRAQVAESETWSRRSGKNRIEGIHHWPRAKAQSEVVQRQVTPRYLKAGIA